MTENGAELLSLVPRTVEEIEAFMAGGDKLMAGLNQKYLKGLGLSV